MLNGEFLYFAGFHAETNLWYNYPRMLELSAINDTDALIDRIFNTDGFDFVIMSTNKDLYKNKSAVLGLLDRLKIEYASGDTVVLSRNSAFAPGGDYKVNVKNIQLVESEGTSGSIDEFALTSGGVRVSGWAADLLAKVPGDAVLMIDDRGQLLWANTLGVDRPDVAAARKGPALVKSGYSMTIPAYLFVANGSRVITGYAYVAVLKKAFPLAGRYTLSALTAKPLH